MEQTTLRKNLAQYILKGVDESDGTKLGSGCFGVVKTVKYDGKQCACKTFHEHLIDLESAYKAMTALVQECVNAVGMSHCNVVRSYGLYFPSSASFPSIVMEYLPYCLGKMLLNQGSVISELKPFILADVAAGLLYLHSMDIVHRDLKADNVLLTKTWSAKISDFGQAKIIPKEHFLKHTAVPGSPVYMPPEAKRDTGLQKYNSSLDIFSFGVLILHTYLEQTPQPVGEYIQNGQDIHLQRRRPPLDYFSEDIVSAVPVSHVFRSLLERCLEEASIRRPSTQELAIETQDIRNDEFGPFKEIYVKLALRERELEEEACTLKEENKMLWEDLLAMKSKWEEVEVKAKIYREKQKQGKEHTRDVPQFQPLEPLEDDELATMGAADASQNEIFTSLRDIDIKLVQDTHTEGMRMKLESTLREQAILFEDFQRLQAENSQLRDENTLLLQRVDHYEDPTQPHYKSHSKPPPLTVGKVN